MFKRDCYVKLVDTQGDFRFGYISQLSEHGFVLAIDLTEEGLSKINYDNEYAKNSGLDLLVKDFARDLTPTEKRMIPLLAQRLNTKTIGCEMGISPVTVRAHIRELKIKFHLDTRAQLYTYSQGIVKKL
jgi:DNA-binding CsgD family transcriptional regulator